MKRQGRPSFCMLSEAAFLRSHKEICIATCHWLSKNRGHLHMHTVLDDGAASVICLLLLAEGTCAVGHLQETSTVEARRVDSVIAGSVQGRVSVKFAFGLVSVMTSGT